MKLVITTSISEDEFEPLRKTFSLEVIKIAARKCLEGLGENIKSSTKISGTILRKIPLTSAGGAGRAVFLLQISAQKSILIMIRLKNDKQIGENMTVKNPKFRKALDRNLALAIRDIENGNFEEYEL